MSSTIQDNKNPAIMDGFGGSSSSSALGLGNGPRPGAGGPSTNGGLLALDNAPAPAPAQTRTAVVYRGKTVAFLGEDKTSVKVGRTDDNDLTIRGTKGVTLELTWKDNIVAASVKQSTIRRSSRMRTRVEKIEKNCDCLRTDTSSNRKFSPIIGAN